MFGDVFQFLREHRLFIKEKKCHDFLKNIYFFCYVLDEAGVSPDSGKFNVIRDWPVF